MTRVTTSLALCFDAPMQSWGTRSRGVIRDTATEPTKSGVIGLLAAALGRPRDDDAAVARLAELRLAVRIDREGILERDFHTTQNVPTTAGTGHRTIVSERYYLADALFLVVLEGDPEMLTALHEAVQRPHWPLFFGRRAFVPARPLVSPFEGATLRSGAGLLEQPAEQVLNNHPWLELCDSTRRSELAKTERITLRTVVECPLNTAGAEVRLDHPVSFVQGNRRFRPRTVLAGQIPLTAEMISAGDVACF